MAASLPRVPFLPPNHQQHPLGEEVVLAAAPFDLGVVKRALIRLPTERP